MTRIVTAGASPSIQKTAFFRLLELGQVNRSTGYRLDASGKAVNAARVLQQLSPGCCVNVSPLGEENATLFLQLAVKDSLPIVPVTIPGRTRFCYTLLEPSSGRTTELVVDEDAVAGDYHSYAETFLTTVSETLQDAQAFLLAGSRPAFWPEDLYPRIAAAARSAGVLFMADYRGKDLLATLAEAVPSIIKINDSEFCETFACPAQLNDERLEWEIAERSREFNTVFVVTRGTRATIAAAAGTVCTKPVPDVRVQNTIGCGDAFSAGFLHSFVVTGSIEAALDIGTDCATRNAAVNRPGSIIPEKDTNERQ